jgi:hypothetical protein
MRALRFGFIRSNPALVTDLLGVFRNAEPLDAQTI